MIKKSDLCKIELENEAFEYILKYSKRKSLEIKIKSNGQIQVSAPFYVSQKDIELFLLKKASWIKEKLLILNSNEKIQNESLTDRKAILLFGTEIYLRISEASIKNTKIILKNDTLEIQLPTGFTNNDKNLLIGETLKKFYKKKTSEYLNLKLKGYEELIGVKAVNTTIRDQKTRWGSCSSKGNLNFNFRLSMMPEFVFDYIIVHELCHMKEMNHSSKFWLLVKKYYPDYELAKLWVKNNTKNIMFI